MPSEGALTEGSKWPGISPDKVPDLGGHYLSREGLWWDAGTDVLLGAL